MLARKKTSKNGVLIPLSWRENLTELMNETYKAECEQNGRYFEVWGEIYQEELLVVVSWFSKKEDALAPVTLFMTCDPDQMNNEKKAKETQANYMDLAGLFFDEIFARDAWDEFEPNWQEVTYKKHNYYYKLSRENIKLSIEANKLLGDDFHDEELESDEDFEEEENN